MSASETRNAPGFPGRRAAKKLRRTLNLSRSLSV
jgi:hypothetical protein